MAAANDSDAISTVAVIGAGIMGSAMARNLVAAGLDTRVWDRSSAATAALADAGVASEPAARAYGLAFVPLAHERFNLVIPAEHAASREVQALLLGLRSKAS